MRRTRRSVLAMVVVGMLLPMAPLPAGAAPPSMPARYSRAVMDREELAMLPEALGKVTKAGKIAGTINAAVGDIVMPASAAAPDGYAGAAATVDDIQPAAGTNTAAAMAAATVLHAGDLNVIAAGSTSTGLPARIRTYFAMEENTSNQARGYFKARLVYGTTTDFTWSTYHEALRFRVHYEDQDNSSADGCWHYPTYHCTWTKDPLGCRGPNPPCDAYIVVGTYRPKGNSPDRWVTEVQKYEFWQPAQNRWVPVGSCTDSWIQGRWWLVGTNGSQIPEDCPLIPGKTP
jgi:hypothetical protein